MLSLRDALPKLLTKKTPHAGCFPIRLAIKFLGGLVNEVKGFQEAVGLGRGADKFLFSHAQTLNHYTKLAFQVFRVQNAHKK